MTDHCNREYVQKQCGAAGAEIVADPKSVQELTSFVQLTLQQMQDKFQSMSDQIINRIDDMGHRIDDLERNIADLINQAGCEEQAHK